jgi:hypothetical protein
MTRDRRKAAALEEADAAIREVEDLLDRATSGEIAIPDEIWDDPSVVRHTEELRKEGERIKRSSSPPPVRNTAYHFPRRR